eukprot:382830_1
MATTPSLSSVLLQNSLGQYIEKFNELGLNFQSVALLPHDEYDNIIKLLDEQHVLRRIKLKICFNKVKEMYNINSKQLIRGSISDYYSTEPPFKKQKIQETEQITIKTPIEITEIEAGINAPRATETNPTPQKSIKYKHNQIFTDNHGHINNTHQGIIANTTGPITHNHNTTGPITHNHNHNHN